MGAGGGGLVWGGGGGSLLIYTDVGQETSSICEGSATAEQA